MIKKRSYEAGIQQPVTAASLNFTIALNNSRKVLILPYLSILIALETFLIVLNRLNTERIE